MRYLKDCCRGWPHLFHHGTVTWRPGELHAPFGCFQPWEMGQRRVFDFLATSPPTEERHQQLRRGENSEAASAESPCAEQKVWIGQSPLPHYWGLTLGI
jgi:hypothetical protein